MKERLAKVKEISPIDLNTDWPSVSEIEDSKPINPEFFRQQELMSEFTKWLKTQESVNLGFGEVSSMGGGSGQTEKVESKGANKDEEVKQVKKEKVVFDLYLNAFDTSIIITLLYR